jgi:hypothetical protein
MTYTIYNPTTGQILELFSTSDSVESSLVLANSTFIQGSYDSNMYYVEQGQAVLKPTRPLNNYGAYYFDYATKTWQLDQAQLNSMMRQQRDQLLAQVDRVNPVWYSTLSEQQKAELAAFRQALLDVPQQPGFPTQVDWPAKPSWL